MEGLRSRSLKSLVPKFGKYHVGILIFCAPGWASSPVYFYSECFFSLSLVIFILLYFILFLYLYLLKQHSDNNCAYRNNFTCLCQTALDYFGALWSLMLETHDGPYG